MQNACMDNYSTTFNSFPMIMDYHREQNENSQWLRCKIKDLKIEPLNEESVLYSNPDRFASGISEDAVKDTARNLGLAITVEGSTYPMRSTAYKTMLDRAKINGSSLPKLERPLLAHVVNDCLNLSTTDAKEGIILGKLEEWIWSLKKDKMPTMDDVEPKVALESLARIYPVSDASLPTIEFSKKFEKPLKRILTLQDEIDACNEEIKRKQEAIEAHSVRIIDAMGAHEHGVFETPTGKILIDYVTKTQNRTDTKKLKNDYPDIYSELVQTTIGRKLKITRVTSGQIKGIGP